MLLEIALVGPSAESCRRARGRWGEGRRRVATARPRTASCRRRRRRQDRRGHVPVPRSRSRRKPRGHRRRRARFGRRRSARWIRTGRRASLRDGTAPRPSHRRPSPPADGQARSSRNRRPRDVITRKALGDVLLSEPLARGARPAALEPVVGEDANVVGQHGSAHLRIACPPAAGGEHEDQRKEMPTRHARRLRAVRRPSLPRQPRRQRGRSTARLRDAHLFA